MRFDVRVTGLDTNQRHLTGLKVNIPEALESDMRQISLDYKRGLKDEILAQDLKWHGLLFNSIRIHKTGERQFTVFIRDYGVMLDQMAEHEVVIKGKPVLEQWAKQHGIDAYKITVKPHRWINKGLLRGRAQIEKRLQNGDTVRTIKKGVLK